MSTSLTSAEVPARTRSPGPATTTQPQLLAIAFLAVVIVAHVPLLLLHGQNLWQKPHYQFFPIVLVGSAFLAWTRLDGIGRLEPGAPWLVYPQVVLVVLMLAVSTIMGSPWLGAVTAVLALAVGFYGIGGRTLLLRMLPAWTMLWLAIPFPNNWDRDLITWLQLFTARWSSVVLDMLGVVHVMEGAVVEVPQKKLLVEEACSGIHSLFASLCCTLFYVFWARVPAIRAIPLLLSALFWVVVANVLRVVIVTVVDTQMGINMTSGLPHEMLSFVVFAFILGLIFSTDRLLMFLIPGKWTTRRATEGAAGRAEILANVPRSWVGAWPVVGVYAMLAAIQFLVFWPGSAEALTIGEMGDNALPKVCLGCEKIEYEMISRDVDSNDEGRYSQHWSYKIGRNTALVSLDYPFQGWHELTVCYRNSGWKLFDRNQRVIRENAAGQEDRQFVEATMEKPIDTHGYLIFGVYDQAGRSMSPVSTEFLRRLMRGAIGFHRLVKLMGGSTRFTDELAGPTYQIQLLVQSFAPLTEFEKEQARGLFRETEQLLRQQIAARQGATP